jgi:pantoate--beta-alanine ligase
VERIASIEEMRSASADVRREGKVLALVPTMGALHEGHLALVRAARERAEVVCVSIFVNPTQFAPGEDFERYPRDLERDLELLAAEGVELVFAPSVEAMYPEGAITTVDPGSIGDTLCGASRPGHFRGVATVVLKLLEATRPHLAFFGEKDYQQLVVIRRLVRDLLVPVTVVGVPTVREPDGLAMSSRNRYLSEDERAAATVLHRALEAARESSEAVDATELERVMCAAVEGEPLVELEYASVVDARTLEHLDTIDRPARALVAARVGDARLIDNMELPHA